MLLALAAWWVLVPGGAGGAAPGPVLERKEPPAPEADPLLPPTTTPTLTPAPPGAQRPPRPTYTLTVRVLGVTAEEAGTIRLLLSWRGQPGQEGARDLRADPSGTTAVDVEVPALTQGIHTLQVMADGPLHLPAYAALALPRDMEERRKGLDLALEAKPERAGALIGRVVDPEGKPVPDVLVTQDVWGGFSRDEGRGYGTAGKTDADGRFRVLARPGPRLVALVWSPRLGARASEPVELRAGATVDVGTIRLTLPGTWVGKVAGREAFSEEPVAVQVSWLGPVLHSEVPGIAWTREGPARSWYLVPVARDGAFVLDDVATGWWRVVLEVPNEGLPAVHDVLRASQRIAHTRDGPLELDASRARLRVRVRSGGKPAGGCTVGLQGEESVLLDTDGDGSASIVVRPATRYAVFADRHNLRGRATSVLTGERGEETTLTIDLEEGLEDEAQPWAKEMSWTLASQIPLTCKVWDGQGHAAARLTVEDAGGSVVPTVWTEHSKGVTWQTNGRLLGISAAHLRGPLPAGEYVLRVTCDGFRTQQASFTVPSDATGPQATPRRRYSQLDFRLEPE